MARRGTILLMIVGLLAMLFMIVTAYITLARFDRQTLAQTASGAKVDQIIRSIVDVLVGQIGESLTGDGLRVDGLAYQTIPGSEGAPWLASSEPLRQPSGDPRDPGAYGYPALTALEGTATNKGLNDIAFDHPGDDDESPDEVRLADAGSRDRVYNARRGFMDAAGTGVADAWFGDGTGNANAGGVSLLTELANAMDGRTVRTLGFNPARLRPGSGRDWLSFVAFDESARFLTAARVVSHGGMLQIGLPNASVAWNRDFVLGMFRWVRYPGAPDAGAGVPTYELLTRAWEERAAIEPQLRSRLGLVVGSRAAVPESLAAFEKRWPWTFLPGGPENTRTQRYNLKRDWDVFRRAATIDADEFNDWLTGAGTSPRVDYAARQLATASNTSDELARIASRLETQPGELGLYPGQLKYYLGRIEAAFHGNGNFGSDPSPQRYDGYEVIRDLASYYYEMLKDYEGWRPETSAFPGLRPGGSGGLEADRIVVSRREQAYMLAVNTVAFAAPRAPDGKIDLVYFELPADTPDQPDKLFVGYTPQPFFTQALAYNKVVQGSDPDDPPVSKLAVAVELYFPDDTGDAPGVGKFSPGQGSTALNLDQFVITLNNANPIDPSAFVLLSRAVGNHPRLVGKNFIAFSINGQGGNTAFDLVSSEAGVDGTIDSLPVTTLPEDPAATPPKPRRIEVKLWRLNNADTLRVLVDRIIISLEDLDEAEDNQREWLVSVQRDTRPQRYLGGEGENLARWRIVAATESGEFAQRAVHRGSLLEVPEIPAAALETARQSLNNRFGWKWVEGQGALLYEPAIDAAPTVPLYTMNAGAEPWDFGSTGAASHVGWRPASFPTVGFLLFVPRFSHFFTGGKSYPMTEVLGEQALRTSNASQLADFGHMPIFDNGQEVAGTSVFHHSRLGKVPWGLLVYDYFTTLDPRGPDARWNTADDVDPYRVLGRIDINVAPWHMLAGLPVIGPLANGDLPLPPTASPAFRLASAGVLAGVGDDDTPRFMSNDPRLIPPNNSVLGQGWWRLGPYLAQAAAAYRDGVQYSSQDNAPPRFPFAFARNRSENPTYVYRSPIYGSIRQARGFVTVGELANVMGFDGSSNAELDAGPDATVLGGYGQELGGDFMKAVSLLALLDTQHLTTRSNTYTVYTTLLLNDPDDPQASVRAQVTIDRSNLLPRLVMDDRDGDGFPETPRLEPMDTDGDGTADRYAPVIIRNIGAPETLGRREIAYFNTRYDE